MSNRLFGDRWLTEVQIEVGLFVSPPSRLGFLPKTSTISPFGQVPLPSVLRLSPWTPGLDARPERPQNIYQMAVLLGIKVRTHLFRLHPQHL